jgi:hypothetical protein
MESEGAISEQIKGLLDDGPGFAGHASACIHNHTYRAVLEDRPVVCGSNA